MVKDGHIKEYTEKVYNLEIEDDNSYTLTTGSVHNCIELLGCGVHCIASDCLGHSEYLRGAPTIQRELTIVPVGKEVANDGIWFNGTQGEWSEMDPGGLLEAMELVWTQQDKYLEKSDELSDYISQNYSWTKTAEDFIALSK